MVLWGRGVDEAGRVLEPTGNGLYYSGLLQPLPWGVREGNCPRTNEGGFWVGFPTQVQEEEQTPVSLQSNVARPVWGWLQPSSCRKPEHALCALVCSVLVISCFLGKFLVKAPSLTWLIQKKRRLVCTWVRKPDCSRGRTRGTVQEPGQLWVVSLIPVLWAISLTPSPACSPPPHQRQLGSSERKPKHSLILPRLVPGLTFPLRAPLE